VHPVTDEGGAEYPPFVSAVIVAPGDDPFNDAIDGKTLRRVPVEDISRKLAARWASASLIGRLRERLGERADEPLTPPDRSDPDGFSAHVALRYLQLLASSHKPTKEIADEVGVPHPTAQRWVVDARRRGYLPPATNKRGTR
jgi:hypothetical protein